MNRSQCLFIIVILAFYLPLAGQDHHERYAAIDVLNYRFEIDLNDSTNIIHGTAQVDILFKRTVNQFYLDLTNRAEDGTGMVTEMVLEGGIPSTYQHLNDQLIIRTPGVVEGDTVKFTIKYHGIPRDGLIISENKFGDRTFFGDNWPNRAHHWLAVVDHPSDKSLVEFLVHAPEHYSVVSVGKLLEEKKLTHRVLSHWKTTVPLPTKLMVIGVSPFAVQNLESSSGIPVSSWVYPQNSKEGFLDYSIAIKPLEFFESYIAPYPYSKLANVQSKTVYGGMENASCIFYSERTVNGKQANETLFAHEIAHQWFGDAVSEFNWHHIWISEGFATFLADLYMEHAHGREVFVSSMQEEKRQVIEFSKKRLAPIVDTSLAVSIKLLNNNSYEKAGWVLHMLRHELGDEQFQLCIRNFYESFKYGNALTRDFQSIVERISGKDMSQFFNQWFYKAGHPVLSFTFDYKHRHINLHILQHQDDYSFKFPLDIEIVDKKGVSSIQTILVDRPEQSFRIDVKSRPSKISLDPDTWLLFEHY